MIDIKLIRDKTDVIRNNIKKRFQEEEKIRILESVKKTDEKWRKDLDRLNRLRHEKNLLDNSIRELKTGGKDAKEEIQKSRDLSQSIGQLEEKVKSYRETIDKQMLLLPNIAHETVPRGNSEEENEVFRKCGQIPDFAFPVKDHIDLGSDLDLFDLEKAASASGARWYYLKNEAVLVQMALMRFAIDHMVDAGFVPIYPPAMIREEIMQGAGYLPEGREDIYKIEDENLFAVGTSEQALSALHFQEILEEKDLPKKYTGISPCFRTEVGSHGRDTKGIFRVHQFEKVEMFLFSKPEDSWELHEEMISLAECMVKKLKLPYRVVNVCSGELGLVAAKKYDIEIWLPGQEKYRESVSCSNCTDYQARRLGIRCREAPGEPTRFVHTLNSTALASTRTLIAIMENYQISDGRIVIPDALHEYLPEMETIERK